MPGIQVLDNDEGHAIRRRQGAQKPLACFQAAGRSADRDNGKLNAIASGKGARYPPARLRHFGMGTTLGHIDIFLEEKSLSAFSRKTLPQSVDDDDQIVLSEIERSAERSEGDRAEPNRCNSRTIEQVASRTICGELFTIGGSSSM